MTHAVRYEPSVEPDEAETIRDLEEQFKIILDTTSKDYGHGVRSVHAKGHGIARGTLSVHDGATVVWDEEASPFVTVAPLDIPPQIAWQDGVSQKTGDDLSFSPWHGLAAHQPLGAVNRARKGMYKFSADYRDRLNGCPMYEPRGLGELTARLRVAKPQQQSPD